MEVTTTSVTSSTEKVGYEGYGTILLDDDSDVVM